SELIRFQEASNIRSSYPPAISAASQCPKDFSCAGFFVAAIRRAANENFPAAWRIAGPRRVIRTIDGDLTYRRFVIRFDLSTGEPRFQNIFDCSISADEINSNGSAAGLNRHSYFETGLRITLQLVRTKAAVRSGRPLGRFAFAADCELPDS